MSTTYAQPRRGAFAAIVARTVFFATGAVFLIVGASSAVAATLDRVRETGKLTLGYRTDARPFAFKDDSGKASGFSVALCQKIADRIKADLKLPNLAVNWVPVTLEGRFDAVQQGKVDLLCGADTITLTRRKNVSFSLPVFSSGIGAVMRSDGSAPLRALLTGAKSASHPVWRAQPARALLEQATLSVLSGTTGQSTLMSKLTELQFDAKVVPVDSYKAGIEGVLDRQFDVFFGDRPILMEAVSRSSSEEQLVILDRQFTFEDIALVLPRGDEDFRLLVDRELSQLYTSKDFYNEYRKWFGSLDLNSLAFYLALALPE